MYKNQFVEGGISLVLTTAEDLRKLARAVVEEMRAPEDSNTQDQAEENARLREEIMRLKAQIQEQSQKDGNSTTGLMSSKDVCKMLGVSLPTLWRWQKAGFLVPLKIGKGKNSLKYKLEDVNRILNQI
jgi:DNA-binding transcriptional MerR regulator